MAQTKQQINVGGPRADAMQRGEHAMGFVGRQIDQAGKIEFAFVDGFGEGFQGLDFAGGQPGAHEFIAAGTQDRRVIQWVERGGEPAEDRLGAGGRELLRDHDRGEAGKAIRASPQRRTAGDRQDLSEPRIRGKKTGEGPIEIGFGVNVK